MSPRTFTILDGGSGAGKSTLAHALHSEFQQSGLTRSRSLSTRTPRPGQNEEHEFVDVPTFWSHLENHTFLATKPMVKCMTTDWRQNLGGTLKPTKPHTLAILSTQSTLNSLPWLRAHRVEVFYILLDASEETLRSRMLARGEDVDTIDQRLAWWRTSVWRDGRLQRMGTKIDTDNRSAEEVFHLVSPLVREFLKSHSG